jgi:hypothetical protein
MGRSRPPHPADLIEAGPAPRGPPPRALPEVAVSLKKIITWLVVAFLVFYVIRSPDDSARIVKDVGQALGNAASALAKFVGSLV